MARYSLFVLKVPLNTKINYNYHNDRLLNKLEGQFGRPHTDAKSESKCNQNPQVIRTDGLRSGSRPKVKAGVACHIKQ